MWLEWATEDWTIRNAVLKGTYQGPFDWSSFVVADKQLTAKGSLAGWADAGFPILEASNDRYAASLMCTSAEGLALEELRTPGPTVVFSLPQTEMMDSFVAMLSMRSLSTFMLEVSHYNTSYILRANSLTELLYANSERKLDTDEEKALNLARVNVDTIKGELSMEARVATLKEIRRFDLIRNYVAGLMLAYQTKSNHTYEGLALSRVKKLRGFDPKHRLAILGQKTKTDMRTAIRRYIDSDERNGLSFQFIVRGHYRDQACGPKHKQRKQIWIEPFWKGPEEAIIHARAVQFQPPPNSPSKEAD